MPGRRTYLSILQSEDGQLMGSVVEAPVKVNGHVAPLSIGTPGPLETASALEAHGAAVRDGLMAHPDFRDVLDSLHRAPQRESWSVMFGVSGPLGEAIRWEAVRGPDDAHVTLTGSRRIFRVAADPSSPDLPIRYLPETFRLSAFLSPARVDVTAELAAVKDAHDEAKRCGLVVDVTVYTSDARLLGQGAHVGGGLTFEPVPRSALEIQAELVRSKPHIVHFFCHGMSEAPQSLRFASVSDVLTDAPVGSVPFSIDRLVTSAALAEAWAVTFNCCDGGTPTPALNSMAYRTVAEAGIPMAVGMGAPLPASAAPVFTRAFYRGLFCTLASASAEVRAGGVVAIDFGEAITEGRRALHEAVCSAGAPPHCWALPIIYLHRKDFMAQRSVPAADATDVATRVDLVARMLRTLPPSTPEAARADMLALFDEPPVVPLELRCDAMGAFRGAR